MKYQVEVVESAKRSLRKVESLYIKKIMERIDFLQFDPRHPGCIKMSGCQNTYRTRVGKYRIIYEIYDNKVLVIVVNIGHRKDVYRGCLKTHNGLDSSSFPLGSDGK